jgi:hypothetical protein
MMIEQRETSQKLVRRVVTIAMLSSLILAAGTDWAAAATLQELTGPGTAEIFVTVLFATALCLLAALMRQGRESGKQAKRVPVRVPASQRRR